MPGAGGGEAPDPFPFPASQLPALLVAELHANKIFFVSVGENPLPKTRPVTTVKGVGLESPQAAPPTPTKNPAASPSAFDVR